MRVLEVKIYQFQELSEKAKEKARAWYREGGIDFEFEAKYIMDDIKHLCALFGLDIDNVFYSGFWSQGDGACFTGNYSYKKGGLEALKSEAPSFTALHDIAETLEEAQRKHGFQLSASISKKSHNYQHENTVNVEVSHIDDIDEKEFSEEAETVEEALKDIMRLTYRRLEEAYEYLNSDESVDENIIVNEYEFLESGKRY